MNERNQEYERQGNRDPLGLSRLPAIEPAADDWAAIRAALEEDSASSGPQHRPVFDWRRAGGLAVAASVILAVALIVGRAPAPSQPGPAVTTEPVEELIAMSQVLESRLRRARADTGVLPARSLLWVSELEDMIARVDGELSMTPESVDLWGQRVNLLLDLESIYMHQFEREYGRMASL